MMKAATVTSWPTGSGATTGYEPELWATANALRGPKYAAKVKHVVLGLVFLKSISEAIEELGAAVLAECGAEAAEDGNEYTSESIFWVSEEIRWANLEAQARQPTIGQVPDREMAAINQDKPSRKEELANDDTLPALDEHGLGQLIAMVGNVRVGGAESRLKDLLGWVNGFFPSECAIAGDKRGRE